MSNLEIASLLQPILPDKPCGEDLSADAEYMELERLAQGTPERGVGTTVVAATEPDWRQLHQRCKAMLARGKDLRVVVFFSLAILKLEGLPGLREGLALLKGLIERYWEGLYPRLDPEDNNDPLERLNILAAFAPATGGYGDPLQFRQRLRDTPLCNSPIAGRFTLRQIAVARGEVPPPSADFPKTDPSLIDAAFADSPLELLEANLAAATGIAQELDAIRAALLKRVGEEKLPDFSVLRKAAVEAEGHLKRYLEKRPDRKRSAAGDGAAEGGAASAGTAAKPKEAPSGEIRGRQDVIVAIDRICRYYEQNEPSSPVPLVLQCAKRLVDKSFLEIMQQLPAPAFAQLKVLSGTEPAEVTPAKK